MAEVVPCFRFEAWPFFREVGRLASQALLSEFTKGAQQKVPDKSSTVFRIPQFKALGWIVS